jgi:hypothetical protein
MPYEKAVLEGLVWSSRNWRDEAWDNDNRKTNLTLKDGDRVRLRFDTINHVGLAPEFQLLVFAGTEGTVAVARTPRVYGGGWFANVDVDDIDPHSRIGGKIRIRVPHNSLEVIKK